MSIIHKFRGQKSLRLALSILEKRDRRMIFAVIVIQVFLAGLDLVGVLTIGLVGSLAVTGISSSKPGTKVSLVLDSIKLGNSTLQVQVAVLGTLAAITLIIKTILTMYFSKRIIYFLARRGAAISANLILRYFSRPITILHIRSTQESIYALTSGVNSVMVGLIGSWISLITDITLLIILGIGLFIVDIGTSLATLAIFALTAYVLHYLLHERIQRLGASQATLSIKGAELIDQAIHSYRELLVRNRRGYFANQIANSRYALANGSAAMGFMQNLNKYVLEIAMVLTSIVMAGYQFSTQTASRAIAVVGIFIAASARIMPAVLRVQQGLFSIKSNLGSAKPTIFLMEEIRELRPIIDETKSFVSAHEGFTGEIHVENVTFSYTPGKAVIKRINMHVKSGEFIGIVGESGAGKTTLVDVILGAIEPDIGQVKISGKPSLETFAKWPGAVSYIPQDITILNGTVKENICLGYPSDWISDELCWESLRLAKLDAVVEKLPSGLQSQVGDRGTKLSGGQKQRLGIARALITRPKLLILDEATSALDGITEAEISDSLRTLRGEVTLIVIAHRLSTILDADRIYFLEQGAVIASGSFVELRDKVPSFRAQAETMGI